MLDKATLGSRYTCFKCGTKFYDLNRPAPTCPECEADQNEAPVRDIRALLGGRGSTRRYTSDDEEESDSSESGEEDDELGLLNVDDDDEDDDDDDIEEDDD